jgi:hypothetical protein
VKQELERIERLTITGPMGEFVDALKRLDVRYSLVSSGPLRTATRTIDESQFEIIAERVLLEGAHEQCMDGL